MELDNDIEITFNALGSLNYDAQQRKKNKLWKKYKYLSYTDPEKSLSYSIENEKLLNQINQNSSFHSLINSTCESCK